VRLLLTTAFVFAKEATTVIPIVFTGIEPAPAWRHIVLVEISVGKRVTLAVAKELQIRKM